MKDYELDKSKKGLFILNYVIDNNEIIVKYANGNSVTIPLTEKNQKILLESMKNQVENSNDFEKKCRSNLAIYAVLCILGIVACIPCVKIIIDPAAMLSSVGSWFLGGGIGTAIFSGINVITINNYLNDIKKNKRFLQVESEINSKVKENENMLYNTHNITKKIVEKSQEQEVVFTINNVDLIPFSDLNQIMENIEREEKFNFEYLEIEEENSKKKIK